MPDSKEEDPGNITCVNADNDDKDNIFDDDDSQVPGENDLFEFWWFFARPVSGTFGEALLQESLTINIVSPNDVLKAWKFREKVTEETMPKVIALVLHQRDRLFVETRKPSQENFGETVVGNFGFMCVDTFHVTGAGPTYLDKDKQELDHKKKGLHVAHLENGVDFSVTPPNMKKTFIDDDPDRFFIRVVDKSRKGEKKVVVKVQSLHYAEPEDFNIDPPEHGKSIEIELSETADPGVFESKSMICMSDDVDDDFADAESTGSATDDGKNDRTIKVRIGLTPFPQHPPGGFVSTTYTLKGEQESKCSQDIKICNVDPKEEKTTKIHLIIVRTKKLSDGGSPIVPQSQAEDDATVIDERFLQCCLKAEVVSIQIVDPPAGVDIMDGVEEGKISTEGNKDASPEGKALIEGVSDLPAKAEGDKDHIDVIYIRHFLDAGGNKTSTAGDAYYKSLVGTGASQNHAQVVIVARFSTPAGGEEGDLMDPSKPRDKRRGWGIAAHEVGHVLTNAGDLGAGFQNNLMHESAIVNENKITGAKRLWKIGAFDQCEDGVRKDRPFVK